MSCQLHDIGGTEDNQTTAMLFSAELNHYTTTADYVLIILPLPLTHQTRILQVLSVRTSFVTAEVSRE